MGLFGDWQPVYDDVGLVTFPVDPGKKKPLETAPARIGRPRSRALAAKYPDASAFGFMCGPRSALTVLDIDSADDKILADCLAKLGNTPLIGRTPSGGFHAYYRHNGERRSPRALARSWGLGDCIDVLGFNGLCIAPPSLTGKGSYELIEGDLGDLARLPKMRPIIPANDVPAKRDVTPRNVTPGDAPVQGQRNEGLFRICMAKAKSCAALEDLMKFASATNADYSPPLPVDEVLSIVSKAWGYTERGQNWCGSNGKTTIDNQAGQTLFAADSDAFLLLVVLKMHNRPDKPLYVANAMADKMRWSRQRFAAARSRLLASGHIAMLRPASKKNGSAVFRFGPSVLQGGAGGGG